MCVCFPMWFPGYSAPPDESYRSFICSICVRVLCLCTEIIVERLFSLFFHQISTVYHRLHPSIHVYVCVCVPMYAGWKIDDEKYCIYAAIKDAKCVSAVWMCGYDKKLFFELSIILFVIGDTVFWKRLRIGCSLSPSSVFLLMFFVFARSLTLADLESYALLCAKSWCLFYIYICVFSHSKWYIYQNAWPNFVTNMLKLCLREMCGVWYTYTVHTPAHTHFPRNSLWQWNSHLYV